MPKVLLALPLLALLACAPDKAVCTPGETQRCLCPNLESGAQSCEADGLSWSDCACAAGGDTGPGPDGHEDTNPEDTSPEDTDPEDTDPAHSGSTDTGASDAGYAVYLSYCSACHGADGRGASGPDLRREVPEMSDAELRQIITEGEDEMPGFDLSAEQMTDLIAWLRASFGREEEEEDD